MAKIELFWKYKFVDLKNKMQAEGAQEVELESRRWSVSGDIASPTREEAGLSRVSPIRGPGSDYHRQRRGGRVIKYRDS